MQSSYVVLEQDRDTVERSTCAICAPFGVELCGLLEGTRIRLDDCTQCRTLQVDFINTREICLSM